MYTRIAIDPLNLSDEANRVLHKYLQRWRHNGLHLKRNTVFTSGLFSSFTLTRDIYITEIYSGKWRYEVLANESLGEGSCGRVFRVEAVIRQHAEQDKAPLIVVPKQKRVYKLQVRDAWHEYSIMKRCHDLHARPLLSGIPSFLSMREIPGKLLLDVLNEERKIKPFTLHHRHMLMHKALRALKRLHDRKICHNDLTPRNMKYDAVTHRFYIFDFGISKLANENNDLRSRGNAVYAAPEEFISERTSQPVTELGCEEKDNLQSKTNLSSDIFSMGLNLSLIWRADDPLFADKDVADILKKRAQMNWKVHLNLFNGIYGLSSDEKRSIENLLASMTQTDLAERPTIDDCITSHASIYLNFKLKRIPRECHATVMSAHYAALTLMRELSKIEKISDLKHQLANMIALLKYKPAISMAKFIEILEKKFNKECNLLGAELNRLCDEMAYAKNGSVDLFLLEMNRYSDPDHMLNNFEKYCRHLADNHYAIAEFVETLDVNCFSQVNSKDRLLDKARGLVAQYQEQMHALNKLLTHDNASLKNEALHLCERIESTPTTFDFICEHAHHIEQKLLKLDADYQDDLRHLILQPQLAN